MKNELENILFRGKSLDDGKWYYGCLVCRKVRKKYVSYIVTDRAMSFACISHLGNASVRMIKIDPNTIGISLGFHDCNNDIIFTGDIVKGSDGKLYVVKFDSWSNLGGNVFGLSRYHGDYIDPEIKSCLLSEYRVVGNIHDKGGW